MSFPINWTEAYYLKIIIQYELVFIDTWFSVLKKKITDFNLKIPNLRHPIDVVEKG